MDKHPKLAEIFSKNKFDEVWKRYAVVFQYVMREIKTLPVIEEKEVRARVVKTNYSFLFSLLAFIASIIHLRLVNLLELVIFCMFK
jgi:hypothetical protein